ncbi:pentatricopeptide repeat-containing protein [Iris pallida]|uniref:Pentatricopeptide repeat-containing protein n=1 Tax=Iris pallida TaxID=29817 RepID=A0AAX6E8H7_IRIPA|nr:pentatricopeptide repeat-containing protein [Iris pallida]
MCHIKLHKIALEFQVKKKYCSIFLDVQSNPNTLLAVLDNGSLSTGLGVLLTSSLSNGRISMQYVVLCSYLPHFLH